MKNRIYLVPTDFTEVSDCAINHAAEVARLSSSEVRLIHVLNKDTKSKLGLTPQQVEEKLTSRVNQLTSSYKIKASSMAIEGSIFSTIGEVADEINAGLVFMGTHGVVGLEQKLLGAFALKVINTSPVPVVVVQKKHIDGKAYDSIIYPVDSTKETKQKLNDTIQLAKLCSAEVHIFEAFDDDEFINNAIKRNSLHAKRNLTDNGITYHVAEATEDGGDFYKQLIRYAGQVNADLIVIMSEHDKSIKEFIIGPDEEKIINNDAQIAVMCVNPAENSLATDAIVY